MTKILPPAALEQHIAVMGKTGSGKTYAAKGIVEGLLDDGRQVVIIDPAGAWWGLRSGADGKKAGGYDMLILGGKHGDLPLLAGSGAAVADLVCKQHARVICDTLLMTVGERTRWFTDFATAAMRGIDAPMTLVIDEVHNFAPKGKVPDPSIGACMHAANTLFSGGRSLGFRMIGITQRPAKWHNDSLGSCDTMMALRMMLPADRKQIEEWIDGNGDPVAGKEVLNSLAKLQKGEGWVWFPEGDVLKRVTFPRIGTYDSSATPTEKERKHPPALAEIDLGAVRASMETAVKEAEANDPKKLRQRVAELERAAKSGKAPAPVVDEAAISRAVQRAESARDQHWNGELVRMGRALTGYTTRLTKIGELAHVNGEAFKAAPLPATAPRAAPATVRAASTRPAARPATGSGESIPKGERSILIAIAQHDGGVTREQLTVLTGYKRSTRDAYLQRLGEKAYIQNGHQITATQEGIDALGSDYEPLPTGDALREHWMREGELPEGERKILEALISRWPDAIDRAILEETTGYKRSTRDAYIQRLDARRLVQTDRGLVKAADMLFDAGVGA